MTINKNPGRTAGFVYLAVIITGMFSMAYVPKKLIDWNNSGVTFNNLTASTFLFRLAIYSSVLCYLSFTFLPLALYRFLKTVHEGLAKAMVLLALLSVPFSFNNLQYQYAALDLTGKEAFLQNISATDLQSKLMLTLQQYNDGLFLATVFWGLWLFPFGLLVYRSGFMPKLLGVLLMLGCAGYLINFTGNTLFENYFRTGIGKYMRMLPATAETGTCLWLLFRGIKITTNGA